MLDLIGIIYFTLSVLYLLGSFPIGVFEFLDLREGYAISDYATLFETSTYFSISAIITGLLCGLDSITNPIYKKVSINIYNYHALSSFALLGIGLFPLTGDGVWSFPRVFHWLFALTFILVYPATRLLILKNYNKRAFEKLLIVFLSLNILALLVTIVVQFKNIAYPEYLMWLSLLLTIVVSKILISRKSKNAE